MRARPLAILLLASCASRGEPVAAVVGPAPDPWASRHPAVMEEYRTRYTQPDGSVRWTWYDDTFRACVDRSPREPNVRALVVICSMESHQRGVAVERGGQARQAQALWDAQRTQEGSPAGASQPPRRSPDEIKADQERRDRGEAEWLGPVLAYRVAIAEDKRADALEGIAKEKQYARYGNVVNRTALYDFQQQIRAADEEIARVRALARERGAKLPSRSSQAVEDAQGCLSRQDDEAEQCEWVRAVFRATAP